MAGFDQGARELQRDLSYLLRLWESIKQTATSKRGPALVYREHDLVLRNIRDYFTPDIDEIYIDNEEVCERAREFLRDVMPGKEDVLHLYQNDQPIFSHFNVESEIESIYKRRVQLKSGGSIVIDGTEALTAIDVNSGRSVRGANQEETAFRTNLQAAAEIARQLRLRDLGGLIVIDFIDMRNPQHISEVEKALRTAMHEDKARHEVGRISHFGLLEVSRQRLRPAAAATSYVACTMCEGYGLVRTTESAALVALRKVHNRVAHGDAAALKVSLPRDVGLYLLNQKRDDLAQLERRYATRINIALREDLMPHQSEFEIRPRFEGEKDQPQIRLGGVATTEVPAAATPENGASATVPAAAASTPAAESAAPAERTGKRRRRRRGRRRGRGLQAAAAIGEGLAALGSHASPTGVDAPGARVPATEDVSRELNVTSPPQDLLDDVSDAEAVVELRDATVPGAAPGESELASSPRRRPTRARTPRRRAAGTTAGRRRTPKKQPSTAERQTSSEGDPAPRKAVRTRRNTRRGRRSGQSRRKTATPAPPTSVVP